VTASQAIVHSWNFDNYHQLVTVPVYWQTLLRSVWIAARVTLFSLAGLPAGVFPLLPRRCKEGNLLYQLVIIPCGSVPRTGICLEDHSGSDGVLTRCCSMFT